DGGGGPEGERGEQQTARDQEDEPEAPEQGEDPREAGSRDGRAAAEGAVDPEEAPRVPAREAAEQHQGARCRVDGDGAPEEGVNEDVRPERGAPREGEEREPPGGEVSDRPEVRRALD